MSYSVKYLKLVQDDLCEIRTYLSQFYPGTSRSFQTELRKQIELLKDAPNMYEKYHADPFYRKMPVGDYLVFYHVDDVRQVIEVHRILHGSRDVRRYIK